MYYNSSKVASIIGFNYYTNLEEYVQLFTHYLYKNADDLKIMDAGKLEQVSENKSLDILDTVEQKIEKKLNNSEVTQEIQDDIMNLVQENRLERKENTINSLDELEEKCSRIKNIIPDSIKKDIMPVINTKLNCSYGKNTENSAISLYTKMSGFEVYENNTKLLKLKINDNLYICGKIDGKVLIPVEDSVTCKEFIVEVKNRKNKLFNTIPKYELVQLLLYSKLCSNNNICFIQKFKEELKVDYIDANSKVPTDYENMYKEIINRLSSINDLIYDLRKNNEERMKLISMNNIRIYMYLKSKLGFLPYKK